MYLPTKCLSVLVASQISSIDLFTLRSFFEDVE